MLALKIILACAIQVKDKNALKVFCKEHDKPNTVMTSEACIQSHKIFGFTSYGKCIPNDYIKADEAGIFLLAKERCKLIKKIN